MKNKDIKVLHITAHLGGGVGKALCGLVLNTPPESRIRHTIACLEIPEKSQFIRKIEEAGAYVCVSPSHKELSALVADADIVQLEWWNHPATISMLSSGPLPPMRLLLWCHISGLHNPIIPRSLIESAHKCLFTSPCSYRAAGVSSLLPEFSDRMDVVNSAGGFDGLLLPERPLDEPLRAGYIGSLNFAKLHPQYVNFLAAVPSHDFSVKMVGDMTNKDILERQCVLAGRHGMLQFRGYTADIASELSAINVFPYLLNPRHYGTTENALLEAMAMGVVPVVLNNPAESHIVEHQSTGLMVNSPEEFANAIKWLSDNPKIRQGIGRQAAEAVRNRFTAEKMEAGLHSHYCTLMSAQKRGINFTDVFGTEPASWFLSCQGNSAVFTETDVSNVYKDDFAIYELLEQTKGTVFHFLKYFPDDTKLSQWASRLTSLTN